MLRFLSIRSRLMVLSLLLVASLIVTNLVLINQTRIQNRLIGQQAHNIDVIVRADAAVQTFGDLKYWLTDLAVSQLVLSEQKANAARGRLKTQLSDLERDMPEEVAGVSDQLAELIKDAEAAAEAYGRNDRLVGNAMMARGRAHILAVDSKLSVLVGKLRAEARAAADKAVPRTEQGIRIAVSIVVLVTLVAAVLTFLVLHSVVVPLRQMVGVIREMSAGRMEVPIPSVRRDEIGQVARVLGLFRESVVQRERAERTEARLREVIENISEGFALFDADDRLVLSNRWYRDHLHYKGMAVSTAHVVTPGTHFETIIRAAVESGMIPDAEGGVDAWVAERLAAHREPSGPLVQQRKDGNWIQINEHRTEDGGTVAIYTDITELKRREEELAQKTVILEATLENMGQGISMFDAGLNLIVYNRKFLDLWGYPPGRFKAGSGLEEIFRYNAERGEYGSCDVEEQVRERLEFAKRFEPQVYERTRPNGSVIEMRRTPLPAGGFVTTYTDVTERKRAEQALWESEARLKAIADHSPAVICLKDIDSKYIFVNKQFEKLHGVTMEEVIGKTAHEIFPAEIADPFVTHDRSVLESAAAVEREQLIHSLAGHRTFIEVKFPILDPRGRALAVGLIGTDITERKRAEESLREANSGKDTALSELQAVLDTIEYGILFLDSDLRVRVDNRAYRRIWGIPEDLVARKPHARALIEYNRAKGVYDVRDDEWEAYLDARIAAIKKGAIAPMEMRHADGKVIQYQCTALPNGGRMLTYFDITELKRAEAALRESEQRLTTVVDNMPAMVYLKDRDGRFTLINRRFEELYQTTKERVTGNTVYDLFPKPEADVFAAHDRKVIQQHRVIERELTIDRGDGPHTFIALKFPILDPSGDIVAIGGVEHDITDRKRAEIELRRAKDQAMAAATAKSQFLANMSHELRTPLNAIIGYTELIADNIYGEMPDQARGVIERVERNAHHLLGMINNVLDLSKIEAGHFALTLNDYSMKEVVDTVVTSVESLGAEKDLALKAKVPRDLPLAQGDEHRIAQVLLNLVGNAIKFTDAGEVSVEVTEADGAFVVRVSDTGVGISEADQRAIFEEFRQADDSSTREKGGTGLGLAIAKRMIELHGGRLWVESSPGQGSTFSFSLPVRVEQQRETT